jgi:ADP-ribosylglycohydrolase
MTSSQNRRQLALRSLRGLAVGDAFGETMFGDPLESAKRTAKRLLQAQRPWRWTDDTAMALSIVEVLFQHGQIHQDDLISAFVQRWADQPDRGYGQGAFLLLTRVAYGVPWRQQAASLFSGQGSFGNGAAMRAAPIGAYFFDDLERVREQAILSAETTHTHRDGIAGAVAVAIATALVTRGVDRADLLREVVSFVPQGNTRAGIERAITFDFDTPVFIVGADVGTGLDVAAHDTVPLSLWVAAKHMDNYEDALWSGTSQAGDRDTIGAIVGGIVAMTATTEIPVLWAAATEALPHPFNAA